MRKTMSDEVRFWSHVAIGSDNSCWLWRSTKSKTGYGVIRVGSLTDGTRRNVLAHRFICELAYSKQLLPGWQALHKCDVKGCVNPQHLYVGTHQQNMTDAKERHLMRTSPRPGASNPNAKLQLSEAQAIKSSNERSSILANRYGVSRTHIWHIKTGKSWGGSIGA